MSYQEDRLKRTELKYFGLYLLDNSGPGQYIQEHDETEEKMRDRAFEELMEQVDDLGDKQRRTIREAAVAIDAVGERAGFFSGMKAGARLVLNLLDGGEIVF